MQGYVRDAAGFGPFRYCTTNAFLTGQIIQRATHMPVDRYTEEKIMRPLGIRRWHWSYSPSKETMTGGGLELRSRDLAKIAWMIVSDGRWQAKQIVPKRWIDAALTVRRASRPNQNYGYFIFEGEYQTACGRIPVWRGTSVQTVEMLEKYILAALPCANN